MRAKEIVGCGLDAIEESALRAGGIIRSPRQIVDGSAVVRRPVDLNRLVREAAALTLVGRSDRFALKLRLAAHLVVPVDPVQLQQLMINLIRNAADAVEDAPRREIVVTTAVANGTVEIRVEDSGPGIAPNRLTDVFEAFVSSKPGGMGVGLAISRTIVEAHGGRISAANRKSGGAVFRISLPLAEETTGTALASAPAGFR